MATENFDDGPATRLNGLLASADLDGCRNLLRLANQELIGRWLRSVTWNELHALRTKISEKIKVLEAV